jgi:surfeit locus 1 family protein
MGRRTVGFLVFAGLVVSGCLRLGFWQLDRLRARQTANRALLGRLDSERADLAVVLRDSVPAGVRRVVATGRFDYEREVVLTARGRQGSPGVHLITPLLTVGSDAAILVNRGWVYAADGMTVSASAWREPASDAPQRVFGFIDQYPEPSGRVTLTGRPWTVQRLAYDSLRSRFPYPIARVLLVLEDAVGDNAASTAQARPARLDLPTPSEGSHRAYAVQWFAFAATGMIGMIAVARKALREAA